MYLTYVVIWLTNHVMTRAPIEIISSSVFRHVRQNTELQAGISGLIRSPERALVARLTGIFILLDVILLSWYDSSNEDLVPKQGLLCSAAHYIRTLVSSSNP